MLASTVGVPPVRISRCGLGFVANMAHLVLLRKQEGWLRGSKPLVCDGCTWLAVTQRRPALLAHAQHLAAALHVKLHVHSMWVWPSLGAHSGVVPFHGLLVCSSILFLSRVVLELPRCG